MMISLKEVLELAGYRLQMLDVEFVVATKLIVLGTSSGVS